LHSEHHLYQVSKKAGEHVGLPLADAIVEMQPPELAIVYIADFVRVLD
jgi:hypothetical protein